MAEGRAVQIQTMLLCCKIGRNKRAEHKPRASTPAEDECEQCFPGHTGHQLPTGMLAPATGLIGILGNLRAGA